MDPDEDESEDDVMDGPTFQERLAAAGLSQVPSALTADVEVPQQCDISLLKWSTSQVPVAPN